ncbi:hypothetical protein [Janibacter indicus]|uniref:hypothetical protein n=1 Tax=Janibacter indicus TaxID=857417 RepID=UPI003EBA3D8E
MRKVTVLGSAAAFTLTVALPALAVLPTDVIVSPAGKGLSDFLCNWLLVELDA